MEGEAPTEQDGDDAREVGVKHPRPPPEHRHPSDYKPLPCVLSQSRLVGARVREEEEREEGRVQKGQGEGEDEVGRSECSEGARVGGERLQEG